MLNRLKQYDWRNFNYSLVIIVVILCLVSAFTLKLAGGVEKGRLYERAAHRYGNGVIYSCFFVGPGLSFYM